MATTIEINKKDYDYEIPKIDIQYMMVYTINDSLNTFKNMKNILEYNSEIVDKGQKILNDELMSWKNKTK